METGLCPTKGSLALWTFFVFIHSAKQYQEPSLDHHGRTPPKMVHQKVLFISYFNICTHQ